jgi:hypothetical protein
VTGGPRDELVEARADFILAGAHTAKAFEEHFEAQIHGGEFEAQMHSGESEAQMNRGTVRKLLAPLRIFCRKGVILLAVMLAPCALLGYAACTAGPAPVTLSSANGVAAVNTASGRLATGPGSVWVTHQGSGTVSRIDARTDQVTASGSFIGVPTALVIEGGRIWTGIRRTAVTADGNTGVKFPGFPRGR